MKSSGQGADADFLLEQVKLQDIKAAEEVYVYKAFPGTITDIVDADNFTVEGDATDFLAQDDWFIASTQNFSTKFRIEAGPSYGAATGITNIQHSGNLVFSNARDIGAYVGKRFDVRRQVKKNGIGNITQAFEGPTLNQMAYGASYIEFDDRAYVDLYDESAQSGVFFQKSWNGTVTPNSTAGQTTTLDLSIAGLTVDILTGYKFRFIRGYYEGQSFPVVSNAAADITIFTDPVLTNVIDGDEFIVKIENIFWAEILAGFKGTL